MRYNIYMLTSFNWIDWIIVAATIYYSYQGWEPGFADLGLSFISFLASLWLAIRFHAPVGNFLSDKFGIAPLWTTVLGYIIVGFVAEAILSEVMQLFLTRLPKKLISSKVNKWLGVLVSGLNGLVVITFFLLITMALPLRGTIKNDIKHSVIGTWLVAAAEKYGGPLTSSIEDVKAEAMKFKTIEPDSKERIALDVAPKESDLRVDEAAERQMVELVNTERAKAGLSKVTIDAKITAVARAHSKDMFLKRYFSHESPDGQTPGDRMEKGGVSFTVAGENLAYAPDVPTAHTGLMNSPGHRRNILEREFKRIGIGIIATDTDGMMITQDFAN